jgi:hypothetical protein
MQGDERLKRSREIVNALGFVCLVERFRLIGDAVLFGLMLFLHVVYSW